jgi:hypothetical protein
MVKFVRDTTGRFSHRPHYEPQELDHECQAVITKFLKDKYGKVEFPISTENLAVLIERDTGDFDPYADLSAYGSEVEGATEFQPKGKPVVRIAAALSNDSRRENRLRTTLTHEYGHVHFHAHLWQGEAPTADLLRQRPNANKQICKRDGILNAAHTDWMEWQAGYISGALLMPVSYLRKSVSVYLDAHGLFGTVSASGPHAQALIERVQQEFQVSADAARVRLLKLNILGVEDAGPSLFSRL